MSNKRKSLRNLRKVAFHAQNGCCFYCDQPMWLWANRIFANFYGMSIRRARHFQCTGEHLVPHSEGGDISLENIVAACAFCNRQRHRRKSVLDPLTYRKFVQRRLSKGLWNTHLMASSAVQLGGFCPLWSRELNPMPQPFAATQKTTIPHKTDGYENPFPQHTAQNHNAVDTLLTPWGDACVFRKGAFQVQLYRLICSFARNGCPAKATPAQWCD